MPMMVTPAWSGFDSWKILKKVVKKKQGEKKRGKKKKCKKKIKNKNGREGKKGKGKKKIVQKNVRNIYQTFVSFKTDNAQDNENERYSSMRWREHVVLS